MQELHQPGGGGRGEVAGLDHHTAPGGQREGDLLAGDQQREVPRCDDADDTDRLADDHREVLWAQAVMRVAVGVLGQSCCVVPDSGRAGHLLAGLADRFAALQGLAQRETVGLGFNLRGHAAQDACLIRARRPPPGSGVKRGTRGTHRGVDVGLGAAGVRAHHDVVARAASVERRAMPVGALAADDHRPVRHLDTCWRCAHMRSDPFR